MKNHYLKVGAILVVGVMIGVLGHWLLSTGMDDLYVQTYSETVPDNVSGVQDGELILYGSWELTSGNREYPSASTVISCRKEAMECSIANATVYSDGWFDNSVYHLKVTEWLPEGHVLATVSGECSTNNLTIDAASGDTILTATIAQEATEERCGSLEPQTEVWRLTSLQGSTLSDWKYRVRTFFSASGD